MIKECYKQLYTQKFDNLDEIGHFFEKRKLPQPFQYEIDHVNSSIAIKEMEFVIGNS